MSRRNFILLLIVLILIGAYFFWIFYLRPIPANTNPEDGGGFFSNLNPFGRTTVVTPKNPPANTDGGFIPEPVDGEVKKLMKISTMPIAGYTPFQKEKNLNEYAPALRYVARETGNIYQTFIDEIRERKFSSTLVPRVYEALFGNEGNFVIMRYLKNDNRTIQTFIGSLPVEKLGDDSIITNDIQGTFLPDNISDVSVSPDTTKIFYLLNTNDSVTGITMSVKDSKKIQIFDSPFTEWLSSWAGERNIVLTTKASGYANGYSYNLDTLKRTPSKIIGDINGLTSLPSKDGKNLIFSDNNLALKTYNLNTRESITLSLRTLVEKCVWSQNNVIIYCAVPKNVAGGIYPDSWYQGEASFNDQIWSIDTTTSNASILADLEISSGEQIDAIKLMLSGEEEHLFFVNKKDSFLWGLDLRD